MRLYYERLVLLASLTLPLGSLGGCPSRGGGGGDGDGDADLTWQGGPVSCEPGDVDCLGGVAWTCNEAGDSYATGRNCLSSGKGCVESEGCGDCLDGASVCEGDTPWTCRGGKMEASSRCDAPAVCAFGTCQDLCAGAASSQSYEGCEYFAVDLPNAYIETANVSPRDGQFAVVVSNGDTVSPAHVVVYTGEGAAEDQVDDANVAPRGTHVFNLGPQNVEGTGKTGRAFRIASDRPITAFQFNPLNNSEEAFSNDASLLIPVAALGTDYIAVTGDAIVGSSNPELGTTANWGAFVAVVGVREAPVGVEVVPTADIEAGGGLPGGQAPYSVPLARYEVLNLESSAPEGLVAGQGNLSGTRISADGPVAVFSGNVATVVPGGDQTTCCADHLEEQMFPLSSWGARVVVQPSQGRAGDAPAQNDVFRITAGDANVTLTWVPSAPPGAPGSLQAGQSVEFSTNRAFAVMGTGKISVAQFLTSSDQVIGPDPCDPFGDGGDCPYPTAELLCVPVQEGSPYGQCLYLCDPDGTGSDCPFLATCERVPDDPENRGLCQPLSDPDLILVPPVEQFRSDYVFLTPDDYEHDYLNVVAPEGTSITFDGRDVTGLEPIGTLDGIPYAATTVEIPDDGTHVVTASQPVGLVVYGYDRYVSYGYPAGLDLETIGIE